MKVFDMTIELVKEICVSLNMTYCLTSYFVIKRTHGEEQIFCYAGNDVSYAHNIVDYMNNKNDGSTYYLSDEVTEIT